MSHRDYRSVKELAERYGNHAATIWRWVKKNQYPQPIKLSPGCTRWRLSDIEKWELSKGLSHEN